MTLLAMDAQGATPSVRPADRLARGSHVLFLLPALVLAVVAYGRGIGTYFAQDDITYLSRAAGLEPRPAFFRPLSADLWFRAEYACFGLDPLGYHVLSFLLHLLNTAGVYTLSSRLGASRPSAGAAAVLFAVASLAFTPLHWSSGVMDLLACAFLVATTHLYLAARNRGWRSQWLVGVTALAAILSKETAAAWPLVAAGIETRVPPGSARLRPLLPALVVTLCVAGAYVALGRHATAAAGDAYAITLAPQHLIRNLFTYLRWSVTLNDPVRDSIAAADPGAWRVGLPVLVGVVIALRATSLRNASAVGVGIAWWFAFLLPVLPLAHHTYLYYLYIPWAGGSIAVAALGEAMLRRVPRKWAILAGVLALAIYAAGEAHSVAVRESATRDHLHLDRTMRDATLLRHALPTLRAAGLPHGTPVAFVNPVPGARFDLMTGTVTRPEMAPSRRPYYSLEAAFRRGETLRLFVPELEYRGFSDTIPSGWEDAQCFYFEQRGWLRPWGRGQQALMHQAELQAAMRRWGPAAVSYARVRALGDTIPGAVYGECVALVRLHRDREARLLGAAFLSRWPGHPLSARVRSTRRP